VVAFNRRHGSRGSPWDGRYRCAPVEPGETLLALLAWLDTAADPEATSAGARLADAGHPLLTPPAEFWALGNTPFDRQAAWQARIEAAASAPAAEPPWRRAALGGWAIGSAAFRAEVEALSGVPASPRRAGRPRRSAGP
jgi:putative transposase